LRVPACSFFTNPWFSMISPVASPFSSFTRKASAPERTSICRGRTDWRCDPRPPVKVTPPLECSPPDRDFSRGFAYEIFLLKNGDQTPTRPKTSDRPAPFVGLSYSPRRLSCESRSDPHPPSMSAPSFPFPPPRAGVF